jgi:hypothetical protein
MWFTELINFFKVSLQQGDLSTSSAIPTTIDITTSTTYTQTDSPATDTPTTAAPLTPDHPTTDGTPDPAVQILACQHLTLNILHFVDVCVWSKGGLELFFLWLQM